MCARLSSLARAQTRTCVHSASTSLLELAVEATVRSKSLLERALFGGNVLHRPKHPSHRHCAALTCALELTARACLSFLGRHCSASSQAFESLCATARACLSVLRRHCAASSQAFESSVLTDILRNHCSESQLETNVRNHHECSTSPWSNLLCSASSCGYACWSTLLCSTLPCLDMHAFTLLCVYIYICVYMYATSAPIY
jgi:hypothetical protein